MNFFLVNFLIHKKDVPLRPIVSSIGSVMYDTAKFLAKIMKPLVGLNSHHIVNSEDFVNKIAEREVFFSCEFSYSQERRTATANSLEHW